MHRSNSNPAQPAELEAERRFPCRVRIGARAVGGVESEVQIWLAGRIQYHRAILGPCLAAYVQLIGEAPMFRLARLRL